VYWCPILLCTHKRVGYGAVRGTELVPHPFGYSRKGGVWRGTWTATVSNSDTAGRSSRVSQQHTLPVAVVRTMRGRFLAFPSGWLHPIVEMDPADKTTVSPLSAPAQPLQDDALRTWVCEHDDRWLFIVGYVGLAVVLSVWISLFWLVVVVGAHLLLEIIRQRLIAPHRVGARVLWELKLDLALILFSFVLAVYMEVVLGAAGLGSVVRVGARAAPRAAGWIKVLRGALLSLDDAAQVARAVAARRNAGSADTITEPAARSPDYRFHPRDWTLGDRIAIGLGVVCTLLLLAAPLLIDISLGDVGRLLLSELQPFPAADAG
jgi:hypothetical protein